MKIKFSYKSFKSYERQLKISRNDLKKYFTLSIEIILLSAVNLLTQKR